MSRAARLVVEPKGERYVEVRFENEDGILPTRSGAEARLLLEYPLHNVHGRPAVNVEVATKLATAADALNRAFRAVAS